MKPAKPTDWKVKELPRKRATIALGRVFSAKEIVAWGLAGRAALGQYPGPDHE